MSFDPRYQAGPPGAIPPPPARAADRRSGPAGMIAAVGALGLLLLELVLLLATVLVSPNHLGVLANLFGFGDHFIDAPIQFGAWDLALCGVLPAGAIAALTGRDWGRPVVVAGAVMITYPDVTQVLMQLTVGDSGYFSRGHNLYFNLIMIAEILVGLATVLAVVVGSLSARRPTPAPFGGAPVPGAPFPPMPAQPFPQQLQQPGYPHQPAPGVPPQHAPQQQPPHAPQPPGYPPTAPGV